jgi:hypothetical protein
MTNQGTEPYGQQGQYPQQGQYAQQGQYVQPGQYPQGQYVQAGQYPQQAPGYPPYRPAAPTNTLAIITIIAAFVFPVVGIITGHIALGQLRTSGEQGEGLAKAGLIISYVYSGLVVVILFFSIIAPLLFAATMIPFFATIPTSP